MSAHNPLEFPKDLPVPKDDGACRHLEDARLPSVLLRSTAGGIVDLSKIAGTVVVYCYPRTGQPGVEPPNGWDAIPGARGCTPQACAFRDHYQEIRACGAEVFGLSTQSTEYQKELVSRLHVPFAVLSDEALEFVAALRLPTFTVASMTMIKRLTLIATDGVIRKVFYPVFPPHKNPDDVIAWLQGRPLSSTASTAMPETGLEIPLLSGAIFPDWSVVTSDNVRASLNATYGVQRMTRKWCGIRPDEDRVRVAVLTHYAEAGHAPSHERLVEITGFERDEVVHLLGQLQERDHVFLNESDRTIVIAYPFTGRDTGHRIRLGKKTLNAVCAIDALGAGAMVGVDAVIDSTCRQCRCAIHVETRDKGRGIKSVSPEDAIVWSGVQDIDGCSADTRCTVMTFFCSDDHLDAWRRDTPAGAQGHRLAMNEGLEAGMAVFLPRLVKSHQQNERKLWNR